MDGEGEDEQVETEFDDNDVEFLEPEDAVSDSTLQMAKQEQELFGKNPQKNTVVIPLWHGGYISFNPKDSVSIFAILALVLLVLSVVITTFVGIFAGDVSWLNTIFTAIGHAITGVVGAIVGSAASKK